MKKTCLLPIGFYLIATFFLYCQDKVTASKDEKEIQSLIDSYSRARSDQDSIALEGLLTMDIDQLVSSGTWRKGKGMAMQGMMQSSERNPGTRTLTIEDIRFFNPDCAIVDARYEIKNDDNTIRKMWSSFIVVRSADQWRISAIRNMLPARGN